MQQGLLLPSLCISLLHLSFKITYLSTPFPFHFCLLQFFPGTVAPCVHSVMSQPHLGSPWRVCHQAGHCIMLICAPGIAGGQPPASSHSFREAELGQWGWDGGWWAMLRTSVCPQPGGSAVPGRGVCGWDMVLSIAHGEKWKSTSFL